MEQDTTLSLSTKQPFPLASYMQNIIGVISLECLENHFGFPFLYFSVASQYAKLLLMLSRALGNHPVMLSSPTRKA